jgi:hypothetical protein
VLDLYTLRERDLAGDAAGLRARKGWGDRSVNHLLAAVDRARRLDDHRQDFFTLLILHSTALFYSITLPAGFCSAWASVMLARKWPDC